MTDFPSNQEDLVEQRKIVGSVENYLEKYRLRQSSKL